MMSIVRDAFVLESKAREERVSYEEFLARADEDAPAEWVDGEIFPRHPASIRHQQVALYLLQLLQAFAQRRGSA